MKWQKIHIYEQLCLKSKQEQNHRYGKCFDGCQMREGCGGMGEEVRG